MSRAVVSFVPGPAHVSPAVLAALATQPLPHRSAGVRNMVGRIQSGLRALLGTDAAAFPIHGSGTLALETMIHGLARRRVLVASGGAFGDRLARIVAALGLECESLRVPPGHVVDPEALGRAVTRGAFDTVALVHNETQTGAMCDLPAAADAVARVPGVALVVDAVSSLAGVAIDFDALGTEVALVSVSGKALACPPGLAIAAVSPAATERARRIEGGGYALRLETLLDYAERDETPQTPPTPLLHALDVQLARVLAEGMDARAGRHREMARLVAAWADAHFAVLAEAHVRSPTVTAIENTRGIDVPRLLAATERRGFRIANGYAELRDATFRIGHMGDVTPDLTRDLLAALDDALGEVG